MTALVKKSAWLWVFFGGIAGGIGACGGSTQFHGGSGGVKAKAENKKDAAAAASPVEESPSENPSGASGDARKGGSSTSSRVPGSPKSNPDEPGLSSGKLLRELTWLWQCQTPGAPSPSTPQPGTSRPKEDDSVVLNGAGNHVLDRDVSQGTDVTLAGDICAPEIQPRDLLFIVDTSVSTNDTDPLVNTSCGRLGAMETIIKSLAAGGDNQMGIVTFSSDINFFTPQFYKKPAELFASLAPQGNPADILCSSNGTTNYVAPLLKSQELLSLGRPGATKELFLISDGEPNAGEDGVTEATALRSPGVTIGGKAYPVTIATIMLNGTDTVLEQFIASKDTNGKPMHVFAAQSNQLAKALADLAENPIVKATMKYKAKSETQYTEVDLVTSADKKSFALPPVKFSFQAMKEGIEVVYQYTNRRGQTSEYKGSITIGPVPASP